MAKAIDGDDVRVNAMTIEKRLADIWREEGDSQDDEHAVTRAALWNVVAHTWNAEQHTQATEVLGRASAAVPQRTIVIRANPRANAELTSFISANCHLMGGGRQVCSEEVAIIAGGERVHHVPPLVASLLLPDMPVAVWWIGDLPDDHAYAETLLDPADRLIVDSSQFDSSKGFELVSRIGEKTITAPADLNWARIDEWRAATAAIFDPPPMRERLRNIANVRIVSGSGSGLGALSEALLYISWLKAQTGSDISFDLAAEGSEPGIAAVEIHFSDGSMARIRADRERGVVIASSDGTETALDCISRAGARDLDNLIVRLLKRPEADRVYLKTLRIAREVAARVA